MNQKQRHAFGAVLMLGLFLSCQALIWSCMHIHIVNGATIVHSHPFSGSHEHSAGDTLTLHYLSTLLLLEPEVQHLPVLYSHSVAVLMAEPIMQHPETESVLPPSLRAPPVV